MNIRFISKIEEFSQLKKSWDKIGNSIEYSFDWLFSWWEHFSESNELSILVAEENNKIIGIAPLYIKIERCLKFFKIRKLCFLGDGMCEGLGFFVHKDFDNEKVFMGFFDYIFNKLKFDIIELDQLCSFAPNFNLWQKYCNKYGLQSEEDLACQRIKLSDFNSYEDYAEKKLSKNHKNSIKSRTNKVNKSGKNIEYIFKNDVTEDEFKKIAKININRQRYLLSKGDTTRYCYFIDEKKYNFLKNYFCNADAKDIMLAYATCDGIMTAYVLYLISNNVIYYWNTSFDIDYEMFAPTKLLINETLKWAFENKYEYFDFILGSESYKSSWANEITSTYNYKKRFSLKSKSLTEFRKFVPKSMQTKYNDLGASHLQNPDF